MRLGVDRSSVNICMISATFDEWIGMFLPKSLETFTGLVPLCIGGDSNAVWVGLSIAASSVLCPSETSSLAS